MLQAAIICLQKAALASTVCGWGTTVIIGVPPADASIDINPLHFITGHNCIGSIFGSKLVDSVRSSISNI